MMNKRMWQRAKGLLISVSDRLEKAGDPVLKSQLGKIILTEAIREKGTEKEQPKRPFSF